MEDGTEGIYQYHVVQGILILLSSQTQSEDSLVSNIRIQTTSNSPYFLLSSPLLSYPPQVW